MADAIPLPKPDDYQYLIGGIWRHETSWNGSKPTDHRCLYATEKMHTYAAAVSAAECEPLMAEIEALRQDGSRLAADNVALRAEVAQLREDAARYRWLRDNKAKNNTHCWHFQHGPIIAGLLTLDAAIDAALGDK